MSQVAVDRMIVKSPNEMAPDRRRRYLASVAGCILVLAMQNISLAAPARIVSINLCSDQMLLAIAKPEQIAGLGKLAKIPAQSYLAKLAAPYPAVGGNVEELLGLRVRHVMTGSYDRPRTRAFLKARGFRFFVVEPWSSLAAGRAQISKVAAWIGNPDRGQQMIEDIDAAVSDLAGLARLVKQAETNRAKTDFLILQRRGYVEQTGLLAELAKLAGLIDASPRLHLPNSQIVRLEQIVRHQPKVLIVASLYANPEDQGQAKLIHPVLQKLYPASKRLVVPDRFTVCPGPATAALARQLASQIRKKLLHR